MTLCAATYVDRCRTMRKTLLIAAEALHSANRNFTARLCEQAAGEEILPEQES